MKVTVDDDPHVGRTEVVLRQSVGGMPVHHLPLSHQFGGPANPGVDKDGSGARMFDDEAMHRDVVEPVDPRQVEPDDLH
jgi:hypothetical protein